MRLLELFWIPALVGIGVWLIVYFAVRWLLGRSHPEYAFEIEAFERAIERINSLPLKVVRLRVDALLADKSHFVCTLASGQSRELLATLPPLAKDLFSGFDEIATAGGEAAVGPAYFHDFGELGLIEIGGSEDGETIFLRATDETVLQEDKLSNTGPSPIAPTIYHWLLIADLSFNGVDVDAE